MTNDTMRLGIDSTQAEAGAARFAAAIRRIEGSLNRLDRASVSLQRVESIASRGGFARIAADASALASVRFNAASTRNLERLAAALRGFSGPNPQASRRTADLFMALTALSRLPATSPALVALQGFRGPSAASVRNLQAFGLALQQMRPSPQLAALVVQLNAVGAAADRLRASGFASSIRALNLFQTASARATAQLRGLQGGFLGAYQAAQLFNGALIGFALLSFTRAVMDANASIIAFRATMGAFVNDAAEIDRMLAFVGESANRMGVDVLVAREEFPKLSAAMILSGRTAEESMRVFEVWSGAMRVLNLDTMQQRNTWLALQQMFSKGRVSAEELRRQLEQIPGAFNLMQEAIRDHTGNREFNLDDALRAGRVGSDAVLLLTERMATLFESRVAAAMQKSTAQLQRMRNAFVDFAATVGQSGFDAALADSFGRIADALSQPGVAESLGRTLAQGARAFGDAMVWAINNADTLLATLKAIAALAVVRWFVGVTGAVVDFVRAASPLVTRWLPRLIGFLRLIPGLGVAATIAGIGVAAVNAGADIGTGVNRGVTALDWLRGVAEQAADDFGRLGRTIADAFRSGFEAIRPIAEPIFSWLRDRLAELGQNFWTAFRFMNPALARGLENFAAGAAERARGHRDARERAMLRGRTGVDESGFVTPPSNLSGLRILRDPKGNSRGIRQQEQFVASLSEAAAMAMEYERATRELARSQAQLRAAGIDAATAQRLFTEKMREQFDLLTQVEGALRQLSQRRDLLNEAERRGLIDAGRRERLEQDAIERMRESLGLYSETESALLSYQRRQRDLADALAAMPELHDAISAALERNRLDFLENAGVMTSSERSARAYALALERAAAVESAGASGDFLRRSAGREFAGSLVGDNDRPFAERQRDLEALAAAGAISAQQYRDALAQMTASTLEFKAAMSGGFADSFLAEMSRIAAGVTSAGAALGRTLAQVADQGITSLSEGLAKVITQGESLRDVLYGVVNQALNSLLSALIEVGIRMLVNSAIGQAAATSAAAMSAATAAAVGASWAGPAALVSLATMGANAAPAQIGIATTAAMAQALAAIPGFADGGLVGGSGGPRSDNQLARLSPGEFVVSQQNAAANMGLLQQVNNAGGRAVAAAGAPEVNVSNQNNIAVVLSPEDVRSAFVGREGERIIVDAITRNRDRIGNILATR